MLIIGPSYGSVNKNLGQVIDDTNASALQLFIGSPINVQTVTFTHKQYKKYRYKLEKNKITLLIHSKFLFNPSREKNAFFNNMVITDMKHCHKLGGLGVIIHVGQYKGDLDTAKQTMVNNIIYILQRSPKDVKLLIETGNGIPNLVVITLEEINDIINRVIISDHKFVKMLKICIDTAHIFDSGYDTRSSEVVKKLFGILDDPSLIRAIHLNDCKQNLGDRIMDIHERILKGNAFTKESLITLLEICDKHNIPLFLETPDPTPNRTIQKKDISILLKLIYH